MSWKKPPTSLQNFRASAGDFALGLLRLPIFDRSQNVVGQYNPPVIAVLIWAVMIVALTSPFPFALTGMDPAEKAMRNVATMRRADNSQAALYIMRMCVPLMGVILVLALGRMRSAMLCIGSLGPALPFLIWAAASISWTDSTSSTLHGVAALFPLFLSAALMMAVLGPRHSARAIVIAGAFMALASLAYIAAVPGHAIHQNSDASQSVHAGLWRGIYLHKNHLGQAAALFGAAIIFADGRILPNRFLRWGIFALLVLLIIKSGSASAAIIIPLAIITVLVFVSFSPMQRIFAILFLSLAALTVGFGLNLLLEAMGRDMTFSGRNIVWGLAISTIGDRPFAGFGYMSPTYGDFVYNLARRAFVYDPHNMYLDIILALGGIGLLLFLTGIVSALNNARNMYRAGGEWRSVAQVFAALLVAWLLAGLTESNDRSLSHVASLGFFGWAMLLTCREQLKLRQPSRGPRHRPVFATFGQ